MAQLGIGGRRSVIRRGRTGWEVRALKPRVPGVLALLGEGRVEAAGWLLGNRGSRTVGSGAVLVPLGNGSAREHRGGVENRRAGDVVLPGSWGVDAAGVERLGLRLFGRAGEQWWSCSEVAQLRSVGGRIGGSWFVVPPELRLPVPLAPPGNGSGRDRPGALRNGARRRPMWTEVVGKRDGAGNSGLGGLTGCGPGRCRWRFWGGGEERGRGGECRRRGRRWRRRWCASRNPWPAGRGPRARGRPPRPGR